MRATYLERGVEGDCRFIDSRAVNKRACVGVVLKILWTEVELQCAGLEVEKNLCLDNQCSKVGQEVSGGCQKEKERA